MQTALRARSDFAYGTSQFKKVLVLAPQGQMNRLDDEGNLEVLTPRTEKLNPLLHDKLKEVLTEKHYAVVNNSLAQTDNPECAIIEEIRSSFSGAPLAELYDTRLVDVDTAYNTNIVLLNDDTLNQNVNTADAYLFLEYTGISLSAKKFLSRALSDVLVSTMASVVTGATIWVSSGRPHKNNIYGYAILVDAKTGELLWATLFHDGVSTGGVKSYRNSLAQQLNEFPDAGKGLFPFDKRKRPKQNNAAPAVASK